MIIGGINPSTMNYHLSSIADIYKQFNTGPTGLQAVEAEKRVSQYGKNELIQKRKLTVFQLIIHQFLDVMILILLIAAVISFVIGDDQDGIVILIILLLNAVIGFIQEYRAEKAMEALKKMAAPQAKVRRHESTCLLPATALVPGDLVLLEAGMIVPADLRIVLSSTLKIDESSLTGESFAVEKSNVTLPPENLAIGDRINIAYKSTMVSYGRGEGIVVATGMNTEIGRIAQLLQERESKTPLQKRLTVFAKNISLAVLFICLGLYGIGWWRGEDAIEMLLTSISVAVAAIPEALPAVITIALALGANRMIRKNALIRKLSAVETLGSVSYICSDKTGTITQNKMTVTDTWISVGEAIIQGLSNEQAFVLAMEWNHDVTRDEYNQLKGDPTEVALVTYCRKHIQSMPQDLVKIKRHHELPFDSVRKRMTVIYPFEERWLVVTKGAFESVSDVCREIPAEEIHQTSHVLANEGKRVLAYAIKWLDILPQHITVEMVENDFHFLGMAALIDPPKPEAIQAISDCHDAGIIPVMITGDHPDTARVIAGETGFLRLGEDRVVTGAELAAMQDADFEKDIEHIKVYARVSPEQKLRIIKTLQKKNHYVAMTGDGVNDALALKSADIGIAMGINGTDVSKEAAHMILLDDNFATIIKAIKEGRRIFDNIRKFVKYIMTGNSGEIWTIVLAMISGFPIPLIPIQILWINLVSDSLPALGFTTEKAEENILKRKPRKPGESIFAGGISYHILWVGFLMGLVCFGAQVYFVGGKNEHWQTMVFTVLSISQIGHAMAIRSDTKSIFEIGVFGNRQMLWAVFITISLQIMVIYIPFLQEIFNTHALSVHELMTCLGLSSIVFWAVELEKLIRNYQEKKVAT